MNKRWDKACGVDVHKRFIDATILTSDGTKKYKRFFTDIKSLMEFRDLTRAREAIVNSRTQVKNRIHAIIDTPNIKLSSVFTDLFGKSGIELVKGLSSGQSIEAIIGSTNNFWIRKRAEEIEQAVKGTLGTMQAFVIKECLEVIKTMDSRIKNIDAEISSIMKSKGEDLKIAMSIPGIGFVSGSTILAEIGNFKDFKTPDKLASWTGIVSSVYQSANKLSLGRITKRGSKHLRWILVEVANAIIKVKKRNKLKSFFLRVKARQGFKKAIVALARKILSEAGYVVNKPVMG